MIKVNLQYSNIVESETRVNWKRFKELFTEAHMKMMAELKENLEDMIHQYDSSEMERLTFTQKDLNTIKNKLNNLKTFKGFDSDSTGAKQVLENVIAKAQTTYDKRLQIKDKKKKIYAEIERSTQNRLLRIWILHKLQEQVKKKFHTRKDDRRRRYQ